MMERQEMVDTMSQSSGAGNTLERGRGPNHGTASHHHLPPHPSGDYGGHHYPASYVPPSQHVPLSHAVGNVSSSSYRGGIGGLVSSSVASGNGGSIISNNSATGSHRSAHQIMHQQQHPPPQLGIRERIQQQQTIASSMTSAGSATTNSRVMEEAFRRLGRRLSLQAHGDEVGTAASGAGPHSVASSRVALPPAIKSLHPSPTSGFTLYQKDNGSLVEDVASPEHTHNDGSATDDSSAHRRRQRQQHLEFMAVQLSSADVKLSRTSKVAKSNYMDHGEHGVMSSEQGPMTSPRYQHPEKNSVLKLLTYHGKEQFQKWQDNELQHSKLSSNEGKAGQEIPDHLPASSEASLSPHAGAAFSQLDLEGRSRGLDNSTSSSWGAGMSSGRMAPMASSVSSTDSMTDSPWREPQRLRQSTHYSPGHSRQLRHRQIVTDQEHELSQSSSSMGPPPPNIRGKGLLSAVMEGHSEASNSFTAEANNNRSPAASISTKDSRSVPDPSSIRRQQGSQPQVIQGKCFTAPSDGVANDGLDNVEGNLIVFENDIIAVPRKSVHTLASSDQESAKHFKESANRLTEFKIVSILGQGTFAQVFKCVHLESGKHVAVKVVKNKPAYTRQAAIEIDVFRALQEEGEPRPSPSTGKQSHDYMVNLDCFFMYKSHLCLVFELLGLNLYEVLKRRQFRGLPLSVVRSIIVQAMVGLKELSRKNIVHCDLKPENILLLTDEVCQDVLGAGEKKQVSSSGDTSMASSQSERKTSQKIKLIDFGSACFEGYTTHVYIQSRFYRCPEVLVGLPYDAAIDMWSLGCVAAELFLGLPILPGVHEHDQLGRITEMLGSIPDWMLDQGLKANKYFVKFFPRKDRSVDSVASPSPMEQSPSPEASQTDGVSPASTPALPQWRLKTQKEYIESLSPNEIRKKGGLAKLEKQPGNRYFKRKKLSDILALHVKSASQEDKRLLPSFVHFLYGLLDPDPWKRWTAFQAVQHPFLTGDLDRLRPKPSDVNLDPREENHANLLLDVFWQAPWDPAICRRKLLNVQKIREKYQTGRRGSASRSQGPRRNDRVSPGFVMATQQGRSPHMTPSMPQCQPSVQGAAPDRMPVLASSVNMLMGENRGVAQIGVRLPNPPEVPMVPSQSLTGPQSYAGISFDESTRVLAEGDFAHALLRPGVVPGGTSVDRSSGFTGPYGLTQNPASAQFVNSAAPAPNYDVGAMIGQQASITPLTAPLSQDSSTTAYLGNGPGARVPQGGVPYGQAHVPSSAPVNLGNVSAIGSSVSSEITAPDSGAHGVFLPSNVADQNLIRASHPSTPQGHPVMNPLQLQSQVQFQPQNQMLVNHAQLQQQHPQVVLAAAPGGGYYYMTMSATGQPLILQPVAVLNQQSAPPFALQNQTIMVHQQSIPAQNVVYQVPAPHGMEGQPQVGLGAQPTAGYQQMGPPNNGTKSGGYGSGVTM